MSLISHIKDAIGEVKFVNWPSKTTVVNSTIAIIVLSIIMAIYIGALDLGLSNLLRMLIESQS